MFLDSKAYQLKPICPVVGKHGRCSPTTHGFPRLMYKARAGLREKCLSGSKGVQGSKVRDVQLFSSLCAPFDGKIRHLATPCFMREQGRNRSKLYGSLGPYQDHLATALVTLRLDNCNTLNVELPLGLVQKLQAECSSDTVDGNRHLRGTSAAYMLLGWIQGVEIQSPEQLGSRKT